MNDDEIEKSAMIEMNAEDVHDFSYSQGEEKEEEKDNAIVLEDEDEGDFPAPPKPSRNLTFRAVIIGGLIGSLVCSSNIYIGLKVRKGNHFSLHNLKNIKLKHQISCRRDGH